MYQEKIKYRTVSSCNSLPKCNGADLENGYTLEAHGHDHPDKIEFGNSWWTKYFRQTYSTLVGSLHMNLIIFQAWCLTPTKNSDRQVVVYISIL